MIILSSLAENCALNAVLARGCTCSVHLVGRDASTTMQGCGRCLLWPSGHGARPTKMFFLLLCCQILISNILVKQKPLKKTVNAVFKSHGSVCNVCINSSVGIDSKHGEVFGKLSTAMN